MRITSTGIGIFLGLLGLVFALVQIALPVVGVELSPGWGYVLLGLAAVLFVGSPVALLWPWIKDRSLKEEGENQNAQDRRRQRIEDWRAAIRGFDFDSKSFTDTDTYSEMRPHLQPGIRRKLEHPGMIIFGNPTRSEHAPRYILLDEVARIEKEWKLV